MCSEHDSAGRCLHHIVGLLSLLEQHLQLPRPNPSCLFSSRNILVLNADRLQFIGRVGRVLMKGVVCMPGIELGALSQVPNCLFQGVLRASKPSHFWKMHRLKKAFHYPDFLQVRRQSVATRLLG